MKALNLFLKIAVLFFFLSTEIFLLAQTGFIKTYGTANDEWAECVKQTPDSGFILTGICDIRSEFRGSQSVDLSSFFIMKINKYGDSLWSKSFSPGDWNRGKSITITKDGGFAATGQVIDTNHRMHVFVVRTNSAGDTLWTWIIDSTFTEGGNCILETKDGDFIITGSVYRWGELSSYSAAYLLKINKNGELLWFKEYVDTLDIGAKFVLETNDNGLIITGWGSFLLKTDSLGNKLWSKYLGVKHENPALPYPWFYSIAPADDEGYLIAGTKMLLVVVDSIYHYPVNYAFLVRTDSAGDTLWTKLIVDSSKDEHSGALSCVSVPNRGFVITGIMSGQGLFLMQIDFAGNMKWIRNYNEGRKFRPYSIQRTLDGGFIVAGDKSRSGAHSDIFVIKTDGEGNVTKVEDTKEDNIPNDFILYQNYPNPFNPSTNIKFSIKERVHINLIVYDILGREIKVLVNEMRDAGVYNEIFDASNLSGGTYFYRLVTNHFTKTGKMQLLK